MIIKIGDRTWTAVSVSQIDEELSYNQALRFERDLRTWPGADESIRTLRDVVMLDPIANARLNTVVMVWGARTLAGETVTLEEVGEMRLKDLELIPEEADLPPSAEGNPPAPQGAEPAAANAAESGGATETPSTSTPSESEPRGES